MLPVKANNNELKHSLLVRWKWQNYDDSISQDESVFEFESQREDIDWGTLKNPYDLHAVSNENDLVGRKELVETMYNKLTSDTIGSCLIFGQKRVGKTSIAQTLVSKISKENKLFPIFINLAHLNTSSTVDFIRTLSKAIVKRLLANNELNKLQIDKPNFKEQLSLSPEIADYFLL